MVSEIHPSAGWVPLVCRWSSLSPVCRVLDYNAKPCVSQLMVRNVIVYCLWMFMLKRNSKEKKKMIVDPSRLGEEPWERLGQIVCMSYIKSCCATRKQSGV